MIDLCKVPLPYTFLLKILSMSHNINSKCAMRCWTCHTPLRPQDGVELHGSVAIEQFLCQTCGRHWYGGERLRPQMATDTPLTQSLDVAPTDVSNEPDDTGRC